MISRQNLRFGEDLHWNSHIAMLDDTGGKPFYTGNCNKTIVETQNLTE